jgi:hypothetical protein
MGVLSREAAAAATTSAGAAAGTAAGAANAAVESPDAFVDVSHEPVMFCVHDAKLGEVSILHGTKEVVVKDPELVRRVLTAAARQKF